MGISKTSCINSKDGTYKQGIYKSPVESSEWVVKQRFGNAFAKAWWKQQRKWWDDTSPVKQLMDTAIAALDDDRQAQIFDDIRATVKSKS